MSIIPFSALSYLHSNFTHFVSTNDNKFDIVDANKRVYFSNLKKEIPNFISIGDENGLVKFFSTHPKLKPIKEINVQKSCIYDLQWLSSSQLVCGGGDQSVSIFDVNTCERIAILKGHSESVKSIANLPSNPFLVASGSRDGSVLVYDIRFNRYTDPADNESFIRSVNSIQQAHFIDNHSSHLHHRSTRISNALKSRPSALNSSSMSQSSQNSHHSNHHYSSAAHKKPSPVACVTFQSEHIIISAGATDGLIKVWDLRKIYPSKKLIDQIPLFIFDNQTSGHSLSTPNIAKSTTKGYSNLLFNHSRTHLFANCLNSQIYEYNCLTYNPNHTRTLKNTSKLNQLHVNTTNFIKSSLSKCGNFLLTGSSDFNAYIYPVNLNSANCKFQRCMPVIALKGHTNEVTCVDWSPIDSNQLVTCSDDNTIRVWNVRRDVEDLEASEVNFCRAELAKQNDLNDESKQQNKNEKKLISEISHTKRMYTKHMPHCSTGIFDDLFFTIYEFRNLKTRSKNETNDFEKELCLKCENINIQDKSSFSNSSNSNSPTTSIIKLINNEDTSLNKDFFIAKFDRPCSNLPINLIPEVDQMSSSLNCKESEESSKMSQIRQFTNLLTQNCNSGEFRLRKRANVRLNKEVGQYATNCSPPKIKQAASAENSVHITPLKSLLKISVSTSKKRAAVESLEQIKEEIQNDLKTPGNEVKKNSKRRLIMPDSNFTPSTPTQPTNSTSATATPTAVRRTILHYFSPKPTAK